MSGAGCNDRYETKRGSFDEADTSSHLFAKRIYYSTVYG